MKINKKSKQLSRQILKASQDNGQVNEFKLRKFANLLTKEKSSQSKQILALLLKFLEREEAKNQVVLESAFPVSGTEKKKILNYFEKKLSKKLVIKEEMNKKLISGVKITLADDIWENTVLSNLQKLKGTVPI